MATGPEPTAEARAQIALDRLAAAEPALSAFAALTRDVALTDARLVDQHRAMLAPDRALEGVLVAVKDIIDVAGVPTQAGSLTRRNATPAVRDAAVVSRLRAEGAIVVGKTNTVELAFGGWGTNVTVGTPKNPWDGKVHRVPGGSSSGSGVVVGAGLLPAALGSDTGGSVRIPAALCGCVGLKTSFGLVSRSGVVPLSESLDTIGPLTRDVATAARLLAVMQGPDAADPATEGARLTDPLADLERGVAGLRLGVLDEPVSILDAEVARHVEGAARRLEAAGATLVPFKMPDGLETMSDGCGEIIAVEGYVANRAIVEDPAAELGGPVRTRFQSARELRSADYLERLKHRRRAIATFARAFDRLDALLTPTTPFPAIPVSEVDEGKRPMGTYSRFVNYLELAALAVPIGLTRAGLPTSLQIVVRRFDDALALRIGHAYETVRGPWAWPPRFAA